jgi:hypothetical protein
MKRKLRKDLTLHPSFDIIEVENERRFPLKDSLRRMGTLKTPMEKPL